MAKQPISKSSPRQKSKTSQSPTTTKARAATGRRTVSEAKPSVPSPKRSVNTIPTSVSEKLQPIFNRLKEAKKLTYDCETSGLDFRNNFVCGHVLSFGPAPQDSVYLPVRHGGGGNLCDWQGPTTPFNWDGKLHPIEADLIKLMDRKDLTIVGHHLNFDLRFLWKLGHRLSGRYIDTMINMTLIDEYTPSFKLEALAERYQVQSKKSAMIVKYLCDMFPEAAKDPKKAMGHFWRLSGTDNMAVEYAEGDGTSTWQLNDKQYEDIVRVETIKGEEIPSLEKVWDIECRLIPVLARMSAVGIRVSEERFSATCKKVKEEIERLTNSLPSGFNVRSPTDVRSWMEQHGHTDWPMTPPSLKFKEGQPSFKEEWLETKPEGKAIVQIRKLATLRDSSLMPLQVEHIHNGRVHTTFNQLRGDEFGTITGRLSSNGPNLQAASKHNEYIGRMHRGVFSPDPGMIWCETDYSQLEPRLLAAYSKCKVLLDGYNADPPVDAHTAASAAANRNWDNMTPAEQKHYRNAYGKRINQTIITGGGKGVLVHKYKVDPEIVDKVWDDFFKAMPEIRTTQKRMSKRMEQRGFLMTLLGRRCRLRDPNKSYVALNRALQGGNADVLKSKLVEMDDYLASQGRPVDMLLNCHDAVSFQFHEDNRSHLDKCLHIMCDFGPGQLIQFPELPIEVDSGYGDTWAEATFGPEKEAT